MITFYPDLKNILLKTIDRLLNPNFSRKYVWALFLLGCSLITASLGAKYLLSIELKCNYLYICVKNSADNSSWLFTFGCIFVLISIYLFIRLNKVPATSDASNKDILLIKSLLQDLNNDINTIHYDERQKEAIFNNKRNEIDQILLRHLSSIPERNAPKNQLATLGRSETDLLSNVEEYIQNVNVAITQLGEKYNR